MMVGRQRNLARALRRHATEAEKVLWRQLRARLPLEGTYFRRQVPIGSFVVDFACFRHRLIIELDGSQHGIGPMPQRDDARTEYLEGLGFRVLRFWNHQVFAECDAVIETIQAALAARASSGGPAPNEIASSDQREEGVLE